MPRWWHRCACVLAALMLAGGHLALLQGLAWSTMLAERIPRLGWGTAVATTFDGQHPCRMCRVVKALDQAERTPDAPAPAKPFKKADPIPAAPPSAPPAPAETQALAHRQPAPLQGRVTAPEPPPPRPG
ncbi:MAG: hypothetical protein L6R48_16240 [Planctomycetes bacterium]|nr:hypothetical protein [Planctomycetota bacterium]